MTTLPASPSISCCSLLKPHKNPITTSSSSFPIPIRFTHPCISIRNSYPNSPLSRKVFSNLNKLRSVAEEETVIPEQQQQQQEESSSNQGEPETTVSVPVSPSDVLTMFFQAEGTMNEAAIPSVTSALQETEGISNLRVQVLEGIASVELKKKTSVQATGVASNLVETIQASGFKLQALNLSFEDEDTN